MRPTLSGGGRDGWWDFIQLAVNDDEIRGQISMGMMSKPKISIDRRTGDIEYRGGGARFTGSCERAPAATERKF